MAYGEISIGKPPSLHGFQIIVFKNKLSLLKRDRVIDLVVHDIDGNLRVKINEPHNA